MDLLGFLIMNKIISLHLPIKTVSEANCSEHWSKKHKRHKSQKKLVWWAFKSLEKIDLLPCHVKLTRISSKFLDTGDNLPCSMKYIRDAIAEVLTGIKIAGRADDDKRITWEYDQEKGSLQAIRVEIFTY